MIKSLLFIAIAPVLIVAIYVYLRDKYEKEPLVLLLKALLIGILIVLPVVYVEKLLSWFSVGFDGLFLAWFNAFIVASLTEEGFKYLVFVIFFWTSKNFNEKFDGIVYAVFISLGFAAIENIFYVYRGGYEAGVLRALTAVPAHALFGTIMGYHFGLARFYPEKRKPQLLLAFIIPFIWHGTYDFLLMGQRQILLITFIPVIIFFWISGLRKMKKLSSESVFRNDWLNSDKISGGKQEQT